jgi:hypothetical protein
LILFVAYVTVIGSNLTVRTVKFFKLFFSSQIAHFSIGFGW